MDSQLSGERLTEERAFVKRFSEGLSSHKVEYPADFSTPLEERPRKVPVVQVRKRVTLRCPGFDWIIR
jgi:hypothetical protein